MAFIKWIKDYEEMELLMAKYPNAWRLLSFIAYRTVRTEAKAILLGIEVGQSLIGDYERMGFTQQAYRTAKKQLSRLNLATFNGTSKGTIATIIETKVYDVNLELPNEQSNDQTTSKGTIKQRAGNEQTTSKQRAGNEQVTTNKEGKKERRKEVESTPSENWGESESMRLWITEHAPELFDMIHPLTQEQAEKLINEHGKAIVKDVWKAMANKPTLKKEYKSANLTTQNWIKRRQKVN